MKMSATLVIVFFARNKSEKKAKKKKVDVHLLATYTMVIFWRSVFCNTT
jgi:hypothetical protein